MPTDGQEVERHPDGSVTCHTYFEPTEEVMREVVHDLFSRNWKRIVVGPCVEGAVFEVRFETEPDLRITDGYLTVDLGAWHFHLCVGAHRGSPAAELREKRPVARISIWERRGEEHAHGRSWGVRMWNGYGEQMTTVFLPSPWLTDDMQSLARPDWSRLDLYYRLRAKYLGEGIPDDFREAATAPMDTCP